MITYRLNSHSGVPPYLQIVQQVKQAVQLGHLQVGDRLPTVKEAVRMVAVNPNTIAKAYRELEAQSIAKGKAGVGTFIASGSAKKITTEVQAQLAQELLGWITAARHHDLSDESIEGLFSVTLRNSKGN